MTSTLTWCTNIFVGCSVTPTFFRQITSFCDSFHYTKKQNKNLYVGSFNYFSYTSHIGSNCYMDTGVRNLELAFLRLVLPDLMTYVANIYQLGLYMSC